MGLIECKCHACGGTLKVNEQATGQLMCPFCGTPYLAEQAINNYYTTVNNTTINNIQAGTVVINTHNIDALVKNGLDIIESGFMKTVAPIVIDTTRFTVEKGRVDELNGIREKIIGMDADNFYGHYFSLVLGGHSKSDLDICSHFEDKEKANIILDFISERLVGAFNFF